MTDFILRHGNDLLAIECLKGFDVSCHILKRTSHGFIFSLVFTHTLTNSLTHSLTNSLTHSLTY